jgi:RHS repeat-associated protein
VAQIYAIVTDHLGTPQEVIDGRSQVVWQATTAAFGQAQVLYAATLANGKPFEMNLRLPGQVFDAETNLHYNYFRDYDPALGRYTTADPAGLGGGINPYVYVSNNPLVNIDPLGLYQIDVHYYMTYFLAIIAGVDKDVAKKIALATQYIDDNPVTEPMLPDGLHPDSLLINEPALLRYHFVQDGYDPPRNAAEILYKYLHVGSDSPNYIARRIANPTNPQLDRLLAASNFAKTDPNATCNSSAQLFGEYLHAFEDTFAHRNQENAPYPPMAIELGFGHFIGGKNPD